MSLANRFTWLRIILSPVFFAVFFLTERFSQQVPWLRPWSVPLLWVIAVIAEFTDMFDGMAARKHNEVSDFGKIFDPFADTIFQITGFLCFVMIGLFPAVLYLVVIYREFGISLIRNLMMKKGITMGARISGKIKTVIYITAAAIALFYVSLERLSAPQLLQDIFKISAQVVFIISVIFSVLSFFDYYSFYKKNK